ncbi:hypothetical protein VPHD81_0098 [Vibrio phage D81]
MKFENVKKGDIVYFAHKVGGLGGFHKGTYGEFYLPSVVEKVTAKFFDAGNKRFRKEDGHQHASGYGSVTALNLGDKDWLSGEVTDQTDQYNEARALERLVNQTQNVLHRYSINHKNWTVEELETLRDLLNKNKGE